MKSSAYEPLEPLRFEAPLKVKPISPAVDLDAGTANGPAPFPPGKPGEAPPSEARPPQRSVSGMFDWNAALAAVSDPAGRSPVEPAAPAPTKVPPPAPEPGPEAPGAEPELADTVGTLMKEAEKAFSGFRDIFRQALRGDPAPEPPVPAADAADSAVAKPDAKLVTTPEIAAVAPPPATLQPKPVMPQAHAPARPVGESVAPAPRAMPAAVPVEAPPSAQAVRAPAPLAAPLAVPAAMTAPLAAGHLPAHFNRLRQEAVNSISATDLDLLRFYRVVRAVGEFFPVVIQSEFDLPGRPGYRVVGWSYDHHAVLFGFLGVEHAGYWRALIQYALQVEAAAGRGAWAEGGREVKLVVFTPAGLPLDVPSWVSALDVPGVPRSLIDVVDVDPQTVGGVYAAARLIEDIEAQRTPHTAGEIHRLVTHELDYFWRRLTRPVAPAGSGAPFGKRSG